MLRKLSSTFFKFVLGTLSFFLLFSVAEASEKLFEGNLNISVKTNLPGFSFQITNTKKVKAQVQEVNGEFSSIRIEIHPKDLDTGISLRTKHMIKKVFKKKPILFVSTKIKKLNKQLYSVTGELTVAENKLEVEIQVQQKKNQFSFTKDLSLKQLKVQKMQFLKARVLDTISINGTFK